jgi:peptidoglycan/xylan/chitin deacetylase (PgdA/CDA1 family)
MVDTSQHTRSEDFPLEQRTWSPSITIRLSIALHLACAIGFVAWPGRWPWFLAALVLCHAVLGFGSMWPRSRLLGPNVVRLPVAAARRGEVALTFDDGPDPDVTPKVLAILDEYGAKASFFCVGDNVAAYPEIVRDILRRGHSVENHSMHHSNLFGFFGPTAIRKDIGMMQSLLAKLGARPPLYFRAPMGIRNPFLDPVMARLGLKYVSWTRRGFDTTRSSPAKVLERLTSGLAAGDIMLLHDRKTVHGEPSVLTVLPIVLERIRANGLKSVSLQTAMQ